MVKKYTITSTGQIKAERDIYSLGGFIPRGSLGGKVASEKQLSQDGECWLNAGNSWTITLGNSATYTANYSSWDALTKLLGSGIKNNVALTGLELKKKDDNIVTLLDVPAGRFVVEYVPTPRILKPYSSTGITIQKTRARLYDNAVLSRQLASGQDVVLKDNAVMGSTPGACACGNGHDDVIIKKP